MTAATRLLFLIAILLPAAGRADATAGQGGPDAWTVTMPAAPEGTVYLVLSTQDADQPAEGVLAIGAGYRADLWGSLASGANDIAVCGLCWRELTYATPASAWAAGANTVRFTWNKPGAQLHAVRQVTAIWTRPPDSPWVAYARDLEATGVVPAWADTGDAFWLVQREDTTPARTYACLQDGATGDQAARWTTADVLAAQAVPAGIRPPEATACDLAWCFATGPGRETTIAAACP